MTDQALAALIDLLVDICRRNGIKALLWKGDKSPDRPGGQAEHDRSPVVREQGLSW